MRHGVKKNTSDSIDLGVLFLENAYNLLCEGGRLGIVLSNSIASINKWKEVRKWLLRKMRLVAIFDLPPNVFAETGVNTVLIVAYKPSVGNLDKHMISNYQVFSREIHRVGYEKRTKSRNVVFQPIFDIDELTFETKIDKEGNPILAEDFTKILSDFRTWVLGQEKELRDLFIG